MTPSNLNLIPGAVSLSQMVQDSNKLENNNKHTKYFPLDSELKVMAIKRFAEKQPSSGDVIIDRFDR